ncbi:MAG: flavodoxin [Candidatus Altiarchaeota archaeon]
MRTLVAYYSRGGNTRLVAQEIISITGGDVEELGDEKKRKGGLGWITGARDALMGRETRLKPLRNNPSDYDMIYIGSPTWAGRMTPAVRTFIKQNDLTGKRIALFGNAGNQEGKATNDMSKNLGNAEVLGEITVLDSQMKSGSYKRMIKEWVKSLI